MKNLLIVTLVLFSYNLPAQYYYNDILGTRETNNLMKSYVANKVRTVTASGSDQRGMKSTEFSEFHEVKENGRALKATSIINLNKSVTYSRFDEEGRLVSLQDSSSEMESNTVYQYDRVGRISSIQNTIRDSANNFNQVETHQWFYNSQGKPEKMWRIITSSSQAVPDSLEIRFVMDENGNPSEERTYRKGYETGYLYYYYDDKNRLSDIVRYNTRLKRLLPDLMFEYDESDRVVQKITTVSSLNMGGYLIWRYIFNEKGLKTKEALFNKDKQLTGRIDYQYSFLQ